MISDGKLDRSGTLPAPAFPRAVLLLAFLLGALTVAGFAPLHLFPLPVMTLALLFRLWLRAGRRLSSLLGFAFGMGYFGAGVSWVYVSLHDFGAMPAPLAVAATVLFCAVLALFPALAGLVQALAARGGAARALLVAPAAWALLEWARGWVLTGFPWLSAGYSQVPASPLAGYAPILGVYGVSLAVAVSAGALALVLAGGRKSRLAGLSAVVALWLAGFGLQQVEWTHPVGQPVTVSLLQGNIPQDLKWSAERVQGSLDTYRRLALASESRLVILPETALPLFRDEVPRPYLETLAAHARRQNGDMIVGIPESSGPGEYYNSAFSLGTAPSQTYRKSHLVPFGEYLPLRPLFGWVLNYLHIPLSDFSRGPQSQQPMRVAGQQVAVDICYEDVFGEEIIRQLPQATLLANLSNDAWFGRSLGPQQHLQIAQMRALETGRYMLRATNTGVTAIIDQRGEVLQRAPEFTAVALTGQAQGFGGQTPFVRFGNAAFLPLALLLLGLGWLRGMRGRN